MHFANQRLQCPLFSYGQKVTSVDYSSPTKVKVKALSGNTYIASYVISTLPLGVMQKNVVAWTPSLPAAKVHARSMHALRMGSVLCLHGFGTVRSHIFYFPLTLVLLPLLISISPL